MDKLFPVPVGDSKHPTALEEIHSVIAKSAF
jgi:hypothetical protein